MWDFLRHNSEKGFNNKQCYLSLFSPNYNTLFSFKICVLQQYWGIIWCIWGKFLIKFSMSLFLNIIIIIMEQVNRADKSSIRNFNFKVRCFLFKLLNCQNIYLIPRTLFSLVPWLHRYKCSRLLLYPYDRVYLE